MLNEFLEKLKVTVVLHNFLFSAVLKNTPSFHYFSEFVWSQEEHRNAGAWSFVQPRFKNMIGISSLKYVGRGELCQPAVGVASVHKREEVDLIKETFVI